MSKIIEFIKIFLGFGAGHERTNRAKKNIVASFLIKGLNIVISLMIVPLTINYLSPTRYGIWVTLSSLVAWFGFFDIGFGNGLRNRFAEAIAKGEHKLAKTYVSTTYAILIIIISIFLIIFYSFNFFIDWLSILNAGDDPILGKELHYLAIVVFTSFGMTFVLNLIAVILNADQRSALSSVFDFIGKSLSLLFIYILTQTTDSSLLSFGVIYSGVTPFVLFISSLWFFKGRYRKYRPNIKSIDLSKAKDLFSIGAKFFLIQIAGILLYQTNNMIISQLFGPAMVTPYNVSFKYFSVLLMAWMIIISPFWSAITEAWAKNDLLWIKHIMKKLMLGWSVLLVISILMLLISGDIFKYWIGKDFTVSIGISLLTLFWVLINSWIGIFSQFLNGVGKIKLQMWVGIFVAFINLPLSIILGKLFGIEGVLSANVIVSIIAGWIYPLQYYKLINNKATGIFNL